MHCSKIGGQCPFATTPDNNLVFVMMPFRDLDNIYDAIEMTVENINEKTFRCERADAHYTNLSIWCDRICKNIRRAKYLIADATGQNANVYYELGFAHASENTQVILITQDDLKEAPFDIADLNHIHYSANNLKALREELHSAILTLEKREEEESYAHKTTDEVIVELNRQLRDEEERSRTFKDELKESEERERKLKDQIKAFADVERDPVGEAKDRITELEKTINGLQTKLHDAGKQEHGKISGLEKELKQKSKQLAELQQEIAQYRQNRDVKKLKKGLLDEEKKKSEALKWFEKAYNSKSPEQQIELYSKAIELDPKYAAAYSNRGIAYRKLQEYDRAIADYDKAIELDPKDATACYNRGYAYDELQEYDRAIADYDKAIELDPKDATAYLNRAEVQIITNQFNAAFETIAGTFKNFNNREDQILALYLELVCRRLLGKKRTALESKLEQFLQGGFSSSWSFADIEGWLAKAPLDEDVKNYIHEKTELLKQHQGQP